MECRNKFCVYQKDSKCVLGTDIINIDINGHCDKCAYINVPPNILEREKEKLRKYVKSGKI